MAKWYVCILRGCLNHGVAMLTKQLLKRELYTIPNFLTAVIFEWLFHAVLSTCVKRLFKLRCVHLYTCRLFRLWCSPTNWYHSPFSNNVTRLERETIYISIYLSIYISTYLSIYLCSEREKNCKQRTEGTPRCDRKGRGKGSQNGKISKVWPLPFFFHMLILIYTYVFKNVVQSKKITQKFLKSRYFSHLHPCTII